MKVLIAVDGSTCTKRMLAYVAAHAELNESATRPQAGGRLAPAGSPSFAS